MVASSPSSAAPGCGRTLAKARDHIRDGTALRFEVAPDAFIVIEDIRLPKPIKATVDRAGKERAKAQAVQEAAAGATEKAARALVDEGWLSVRDAADILGLSTGAYNRSSLADTPISGIGKPRSTTVRDPAWVLVTGRDSGVFRALAEMGSQDSAA